MSRPTGSKDVRGLVTDRLGVAGRATDGAPGRDTSDEPVDSETTTDAADQRTGRGWRSLPVLPLLAAALLVGLVVVGYLNLSHDRDVAAGEDAAEAVEPHVEQLLSYTPTTVGSDLDSEQAWLTGDFARDYEDLVTGTIAPAATAGSVTTQASVTAVGIDSASTDRVVVLMFVNVSTTTPAVPEPQVSGSRLRVTAVQADGEWKISEIRPV